MPYERADILLLDEQSEEREGLAGAAPWPWRREVCARPMMVAVLDRHGRLPLRQMRDGRSSRCSSAGWR